MLSRGVAYFTIDAGVLCYVQLTAQGMTGIVSRYGSILAKWCLARHQDNFPCIYFEKICGMMKTYSVSFSSDAR